MNKVVKLGETLSHLQKWDWQLGGLVGGHCQRLEAPLMVQKA